MYSRIRICISQNIWRAKRAIEKVEFHKDNDEPNVEYKQQNEQPKIINYIFLNQIIEIKTNICTFVDWWAVFSVFGFCD